MKGWRSLKDDWHTTERKP